MKRWWEDCIVYQIYPRSFQDSNGDGIGDLQGIIHRLDYVQSLMVDALWISPIFLSPMADFGYDISDYRSIDPVFGTLEDVDILLQEAHKRGIKVLFDMVLNHTSKEHPWFLESKSSKTNEKADYYIWSDTIPNNWCGAFGGKAWTYDKQRGQYYLHSFLPDQPDLNWRNPETVASIHKELQFWLDRGVDGFRLDVINCIVKDDAMRSNPKILGSRLRPYDMQRHIFDRNREEVHQKLYELRKLIDTYPQRMLVGEIMVENPGEPELAASYLGRDNDQLNLCFDFSLAYTKFNAEKYKTVAKRWNEAVGKHRIPTWVLNNHDISRIISRVGNNEAKAKLAAMFMLTQRGAVFLYYGEELGLPNSKVPHALMHDPVGKRYWPFHPGRDPQRGPMIWNTGEGYGFSDAEPWLPFAKSANRYSVENQELEEDSMLNHYRNLIALRKEDPVLANGCSTYLETNNHRVLVYKIDALQGTRLVVLNFSDTYLKIKLREKFPLSDYELIYSTAPGAEKSLISDGFALQPFQGCLYSLNNKSS